MGALEIAEGYFAAWNAHDPKAVAATFAKGGAYRDPVTAQDLSGDAIADYAAGPFEAFPDLSFEAGETVVSENTVAAEWVMRGANTGPLRFGLPPTDKTIALPGSDFIEVGDNGISAVRGYFDQNTFVEQLGLQALVQPYEIGPFMFGDSVRITSGNKAKPGAFGLTWLELKDASDKKDIREISRRIMAELLETPGFIGVTTAGVGLRMITTTAWESLGDVQAFASNEAHREAMAKGYSGQLHLTAANTAIWAPHRINALLLRCTACEALTEASETQSNCACGAELLDPPPYW